MKNSHLIEPLKNIIINACLEHKELFKSKINKLCSSANTITDAQFEIAYKNIRHEYFDDVTSTVFHVLYTMDPVSHFVLTTAITSPEICGYSDIDIEEGLSAGAIFALCYYAITRETASPKDCIEMNHLQAELMDLGLDEIDKECTSTSQAVKEHQIYHESPQKNDYGSSWLQSIRNKKIPKNKKTIFFTCLIVALMVFLVIIGVNPDLISPSSNSKPAQTSTTYVWTTESGKKYHKISSCSNMKDPQKITLQQALDDGKTKCSRCW